MSADTLLATAKAYLPKDQFARVQEALEFATAAHRGQQRKSGEPYIEHPIAAAEYLAALRMDGTTLAAGVLHDVVEDCKIDRAVLAERFGDDVARLVDGVTKLSRIDLMPRDENGAVPLETPADQNASRAATRAASLRKMFVAMAQDIRVVMIKLADRLHNMRTLDALPPHRRRAIARETLDIYAPLAHRLGMRDVKWRLEDESFKHLYPREYRRVSRLLARKRAEREAYVDRACEALREQLAREGIKCQVSGRAKHLYSIYGKMRRYAAQGLQFGDIHDLIALRVVVDTVADCYAALGAVHGRWRPIKNGFDDYIATPKPNGYQSLHTAVIGVDGYPVEIQIRTHKMHEAAERGAAAHVRYKEGGGDERDQFDERISWIKQLLEWQREVQGDAEYLESIQTDILKDQVFVYTPKGDVVELPTGATPLDFAYRIHTEVGHGCVGARVNGRMVQLNTPLRSGDTVEIKTAKRSKGPKLDWLNPNLGYLASASARTKVRQWFNRQERAEKTERGRETLRKQLRYLGLTISEETVASKMGFDRVDSLYEAVGGGQIHTSDLFEKIVEPTPAARETQPAPASAIPTDGFVVLGEKGMLARSARCCNPVYGDLIIGYVTRGHGVTVHQTSCPNVRYEAEPERWVEVDWGHSNSRYPTGVRVEGWDRVGLIRDVTSVVSGERINIHGLHSSERSDGSCILMFTVYTAGPEQTRRLFARLERVRGVASVARVRSAKTTSGQRPGIE